jgi:hypothetical protein
MKNVQGSAHIGDKQDYRSLPEPFQESELICIDDRNIEDAARGCPDDLGHVGVTSPREQDERINRGGIRGPDDCTEVSRVLNALYYNNKRDIIESEIMQPARLAGCDCNYTLRRLCIGDQGEEMTAYENCLNPRP